MQLKILGSYELAGQRYSTFIPSLICLSSTQGPLRYQITENSLTRKIFNLFSEHMTEGSLIIERIFLLNVALCFYNF